MDPVAFGGASHTIEEERWPPLPLLHSYPSCNLGVAPSPITWTRLAASRFEQRCVPLRVGPVRASRCTPAFTRVLNSALDDTCTDPCSEGSGVLEGGWAKMKDNTGGTKSDIRTHRADRLVGSFGINSSLAHCQIIRVNLLPAAEKFWIDSGLNAGPYAHVFSNQGV